MNFLSPFLIGGALAILLNIPLCIIEDRLPGRGKLHRALALCCVVSLLFAALALLLALIVPQLSESMRALGSALPQLWQKGRESVEMISLKIPVFKPYLDEIMQAELPDFLQDNLSGINSFFGGAVGVASAALGGAVDFAIGLVFAIYLLARKEQLLQEAHLFLRAWLAPERVKFVEDFFTLCRETFSAFFSGQCLEAVVLGVLFAIALTVCRFPYVTFISVVVGFSALVPIFGAFFGCGVGVLVILTTQPGKVGWFLLLFLCLQQIEGNLIYPHVVGGKVGLPPLWVLVAVTLGGRLFGIAGMLGMIPLFGVFYTLLRRLTAERLQKNKKMRDKSEGV